MSLTSALNSGVSGLLANGESMNVIGNNISNVNTVGYKTARSLFSDLLSQDVGNGSEVGKGVQLQTVQNVFSQGSSQTSENVTDLSIEGNSFFAVMAPGATAPSTPDQAFLTRAGAFRVDSTLTLVNPDGYQVLGSDGKAVVFPAGFGKITQIDTKGIITYLESDGVTQKYYNGNGVAGLATTGTPGVSLAAITVADPTALGKAGGSLYQSASGAGVAATWTKANGSSEKVVSNSLEQSNVDMASEFVKMIVTQRAYSANSKTITTTDAMTQEVLNMIR
jgi:flagellar hook protein FlgE